MACPGSLREYIERLRAIGEVQEIHREVDWNLEVGAIMRRANDLKAPAPLFNRIEGYPPGFRILGSPVGASARKGRFYARIATSLGLAPETGAARLIETFARFKQPKLVPPKAVAAAPCKEKVFTGDQVDLLRLPVPYLHDGDGGRYIGTWHTVVTRTPDGTWTNWGMYRIMVHDRNSMGGLIVPSQHIGMHLAAWHALGKPMPFAVAIGTDPVTPLVAATGVPDGVNEADVIGGYRGAPVEVVKCETVDLDVPAAAEIVIEGTIAPGDLREEGPFGEYTGYMTAGRKPRPVYRVSAVTHRKDPILTAVCPGEPVEDHLSMSLALAGDVLWSLRQAGLPVVMACIPPISALHFIAVSVDREAWRGGDLIRKIGETIWGCKAGVFLPKVIVVDKDVDVTNSNEVFWALATRNHPGRGVVPFEGTKVFPLFPFLSAEERQAGRCTTMVFDCTWPADWPKSHVPRRASLTSLWPQAVRDKVLANWTEYGYPAAD